MPGFFTDDLDKDSNQGTTMIYPIRQRELAEVHNTMSDERSEICLLGGCEMGEFLQACMGNSEVDKYFDSPSWVLTASIYSSRHLISKLSERHNHSR